MRVVGFRRAGGRGERTHVTAKIGGLCKSAAVWTVVVVRRLGSDSHSSLLTAVTAPAPMSFATQQRLILSISAAAVGIRAVHPAMLLLVHSTLFIFSAGINHILK